MKQFFKMMFASALGVFVAGGLLMLLSFFIMIGVVSSLGSGTTYSPKPNTVFRIKLNGTLTDNAQANPLAVFLGETDSKISLKDVLQAVENAKTNENIRGIYLESGMLASGSANLKALRDALADFRESGKFVVAYADDYSQGNYYLCSVADKVFLNPQGTLGLTGLVSQTLFYKGLLHKIGVEMQVFKVGTYKGAVEPFTSTELSEANREQIQSYLTSIWDIMTQAIAESRGITAADVNRFADEGVAFATPEKGIEYKLIDELKYRPEAEEYVKVLAEQTGEKLMTADVAQISSLPVSASKATDRIAILYAEGEIVPETPASPYEMEQRITEKVADELIKLKNDETVKAVVFRVNSPGGSAFVSEQIWRQVVELKKVKPIVVSMGNVAASGGYYISCAANKIVAEPNTLTGSIGIFGIFPNATGLFDKLALTSDIVKTNRFADLGDLTRPMTEPEKALIQGFVDRGYETFITRCAEGRNMTKEQINAIGQGRVWTGEQARQNGLVDELGGIDAAIVAAAGLAELTDYELTRVSGTKDIWKDFLEKQFNEIKLSVIKSALGEEYEWFENWRTVKNAAGIQARLPYDIQPL